MSVHLVRIRWPADDSVVLNFDVVSAPRIAHALSVLAIAVFAS